MSESNEISLPPAGLETPEKTKRVVAAMKARQEAGTILIEKLIRVFDSDDHLIATLKRLKVSRAYIEHIMESKRTFTTATEEVHRAFCDVPPIN